MRFVSPRSVLTRLAVAALLVPAAGVVAVLVPTEVAWAQAPAVFEGQGLVELLPPSGLVGDGASPAQMYVLALSPAGTPLTGLKGKPTATAGTTTDLVEQGGGLYTFTFTPAKAAARQEVTLTLKAKTPAKEQIARTWTVPVSAPTSHAITVSSNPNLLTLGQDKTASVSITLQGADSVAAANADLRVSTSAGTVSNLTNLGNGQFSALYTAPVELFPRMALITVSDRHDPSRSYGGVALPLVGKADFPVSVTPNAKVIIRVAGREFGPVQADAAGKAKVPIVVPPGASGATLVQIGADGKPVEGPLDLKIPDVRRVALFPTTAAVPGDGGLSVPVRAMVVTPDGKPDGNAQVVFAATTGTIGAARHEGGGIYVANYTPPNSLYEGTVGVTVTLSGGSKEQVDKVDLKLLPMRAMKVDLVADPATLPAGTEAFSVKATVTGSGGTALPGRTVAFSADGAKLKDVKDNKNGTYQANFTTTGTGPAQVSALSSVGSGGNPLSRVLVIPARDSVPNDGLSSAPFLVVTVDDYGYPVANTGVSLKLLAGDGSLPATVTTGADGTAQVYYTAGRKNGVVSIEAAGGGTVAAASILQVQPGVAVPDLPAGGPKAVVELAQAWSNALASVKVERAGATGAVSPVVGGTMAAARPADAAPAATAAPTAAPATATATAAAPPAGGTVPAKVAIAVVPAMVAPGTTASLRITVTDAAGKGVAKQTLEFLTSTGTVTDVKEVGGGVYSANLAVPAGATGEVKVSAATRDGSVSSFLRVPIGAATAAAPAPAPAPAAVIVPATGPASTTEAWGSGGSASAPAAATPTAAPTMPTTTATNPPASAPVATTPAATAPAATATPGTATATTKVVTEGEWAGPWLRVRAGAAFGSYAYTQTPLAQGSTLFPTEVPWSAGTAGVAINGRAFSPGFEYVGVEVGFRSVGYSVDPTSLCAYLGRPCDGTDSVGDFLVHGRVLALARYPFTSGSSRYWAGARVGYGYGDVQGIQTTGDAIDFPQFGVSALAIGAELGAEFMDGKLFLSPAFTEYLAGGSSPYDTSFSIEAGYSFLEHVYASVNYDLSVRKVSVLGDGNTKVGEIGDSLNAVTLSVGAAF